MSFAAVFKLLHIYLMATVKYFITFPYAMLLGVDFLQSLIVVTIGGISGFYFFYYLSGHLIHFYYQHHHKLLAAIKKVLRVDLHRMIEAKEKPARQKINKKARLIAKLKKKYGFWGIIIMTPSLLSIPIGAFLLKKYYSRKKHIVTYMTLSILGWALLFSSIFIILPKPM
ncbi:hypothetical protein [Mangrovibacterium marinum]|uniref:Uncharacterized protein n=1 Tax=Mangrovibacterium marinum TaxID=1639118 RepID=A0A2T5BYP9_9BACT|nr:hypothetical protein [Mangrovibacterium marinum]PTN07375.1 hypothetical protein C8N47_11828 [Mangrovibacterium marinum]